MVLFYRFLFFLIGLVILTFGVSLSIKADLGAGAWDALNVGLSQTVGLTIGSWVIIVGIILMLLNGILHMKKPEILAIFTVFLTGFMVDFWMLIVLETWELETLVLRAIVFILGVAIIGIGAAIYLQAKFPLIPIDNFMMGIKLRLGVNLMVAKTIGELIALVLALMVKGPVGLGTLVITFAIGPFIQVFYPIFEKLYVKWTGTNTK